MFWIKSLAQRTRSNNPFCNPLLNLWAHLRFLCWKNEHLHSALFRQIKCAIFQPKTSDSGSTPVGGMRKLTIVRYGVGLWAFLLCGNASGTVESTRLPERDFSRKKEESLSMKKRNFRTNSAPRARPPAVRTAFCNFFRERAFILR